MRAVAAVALRRAAAASAGGEELSNTGASGDAVNADDETSLGLSIGGTDYEVILRFFNVFSFCVRKTYASVSLGERFGVQVGANTTVGDFIDGVHALSVTNLVFNPGSAGHMLTNKRGNKVLGEQFVYRLYTGSHNLERTDRAKLLSQCLTDRSEIMLLAGMSSTGATAARLAAAQAQQ